MTEAIDPRYADAEATTELPLGTCHCPGATPPHPAGDTATVRTEAGWSELKSAWSYGNMLREDGSGYYDEALGDTMAIVRFTRSWTLVDIGARGKAEPRPITLRTVGLLDEDTFGALKAHMDALLNGRGRLPNGSGARSVDSSPESASPTRRPRKT